MDEFGELSKEEARKIRNQELFRKFETTFFTPEQLQDFRNDPEAELHVNLEKEGEKLKSDINVFLIHAPKDSKPNRWRVPRGIQGEVISVTASFENDNQLLDTPYGWLENVVIDPTDNSFTVARKYSVTNNGQGFVNTFIDLFDENVGSDDPGQRVETEIEEQTTSRNFEEEDYEHMNKAIEEYEKGGFHEHN